MVKLESSWLKYLEEEFSKPYILALKNFLMEEKKAKSIYPAGSHIFRAFELTPLDQVKVVILGQDPYHGPNQAHGLSFSVPKGTQIPPSLRNIYKELQQDLGIDIPESGDLSEWAKRGVLLLNSTLTVEAYKAGSHQGKGWERFTDRVIELISDHRENIVFILWGAYAQSKIGLIDENRHLILSSAHPSPLSSHRGFFGSRPFSKTNHYLLLKGKDPISWEL